MGSPADLASWTAGLVTRSGEETERAAEAFAALLPADTVLTLEGDLGTGKTTFVRGLVRGLGVTGDITSPSFALLNVHEGRRQVFHVDAYRLKSGAGLDDLMIWDVARSPWNVLVEWPDRVASHLPRGRWKLKASILADGGHRYDLTLPG
jgi:tRNA threonylcarbamoyladenosine biosynthesis protein TsaE